MNEPFIFQILPERIAALFPEIDSDTAIDLLHNNDEYGQLHQRKGELTERYPFISAVLEDEGPIALSAEEQFLRTTWIQQPEWRTWSVCSFIFAGIRTAFPISKKSAQYSPIVKIS